MILGRKSLRTSYLGDFEEKWSIFQGLPRWNIAVDDLRKGFAGKSDTALLTIASSLCISVDPSLTHHPFKLGGRMRSVTVPTRNYLVLSIWHSIFKVIEVD